ncbi:oxidoreductase [Mycobacterium tuberculosis]|nr:oxidoreductase [Mycobacterium tuberculosis]
MLDDAIAWFVGRIVSRFDVGDHVAYLLEPVATWVPESADEDDPLYLSDVDGLVDIDDDDDGGTPDPTFFRGQPRVDVPRRYGLRFTLDGT